MVYGFLFKSHTYISSQKVAYIFSQEVQDSNCPLTKDMSYVVL